MANVQYSNAPATVGMPVNYFPGKPAEYGLVTGEPMAAIITKLHGPPDGKHTAANLVIFHPNGDKSEGVSSVIRANPDANPIEDGYCWQPG